MSKTPEEMAEEYATLWYMSSNNERKNGGLNLYKYDAFLAGYKAAQEQLADADKVMPDSWDHILDATKMVDVNWEELPEPPKEEK
jgi:hypothetical protein